MGNCIRRRQEQFEEENVQNEQEIKALEKKKSEISGTGGKEMAGTGAGMRIKIVLTKEELELLIIQLKNKEGQRLEDVLEEIEKGRRKNSIINGVWKPSLESITESPHEVPQHMIR